MPRERNCAPSTARPRSASSTRSLPNAESGTGDIKALTGEWQGHYRLRVADYRIIFTTTAEEITIVRARHRSDVYR